MKTCYSFEGFAKGANVDGYHVRLSYAGGAWFHRLELRKLTNKIVDNSAGRVLTFRRKPSETDPLDMVSDDSSSTKLLVVVICLLWQL